MASNPSDSDDKVIELTSDSEEEDNNNNSEDDESEIDFDICKDLQSALKKDCLKLPGSYAYSSLLPFAPYPCLSIEGLGPIGLPLSETDAKRVIGFASQAPFGQGSQTIVNKEVRDTWEIDAARVKFENPDWCGYVQDLAVKTVCSKLGSTRYDTPPRCELYKLLVYETGSRFLPHRDTQKADGMFATMIILLPSRYTGGEIHLTHASETEVVDFSASSLANTAVLAWYTDVLHEVKPVTSGYRLALSFNVIHTSPDRPLPTVSSLAGGPFARLRRVLCEWKERSGEPSNPDCIAYLLKHQYSEADFRRGVHRLKGEDSQRMAFVRAATEGLDYAILLAKVEYHVSEDEEYGWCCDEDMDEGRYINITISNVVNLNGQAVLSGSRSIGIDEDCFLPKNALQDVRPDGEHEEFTGNEGTTKEYWYYRSVFVLIPSDKLPQILIQSGGVEYVLNQFKQSVTDNAPTEKDKTLAKLIISNLYHVNRASALETMFDCAYKWTDMGMWRDLIESFEKDVGVNGLIRAANRAFRVFTFDQTHPITEELLRKQRLPNRLAFIDGIRRAAPESDEAKVIQEWCSQQREHALASYVSADVSDIPLLVSMACENGIQTICQVSINQMDRDKAFNFLTGLARALHLSRTEILAKTIVHCAGSDDPQAQAACMLDKLIKTCLNGARKQWHRVTIATVLDTIKLCFITGQMDMCRTFLDCVWNISGDITTKFDSVYTPLVPQLCKLLEEINLDVCVAPFVDFFRLYISHYLHYVLGPKVQNLPIRRVNCPRNCSDCVAVNHFMTGPELRHSFHFVQKTRPHLENQLSAVKDLVTYAPVRSGRSQYMEVKKTPAVLAGTRWEQRRQQVNGLFQTIGAKNVERIMGDRFVDVCKALEGRSGFHLDATVVQLMNRPGQATAGPSSKADTVVGEKRKRS